MSIKDRNLTVGTKLIGQISQAAVHLPCDSGRRRQDSLQAGRRQGIQESVGSRDGDYGPCLRRVGSSGVSQQTEAAPNPQTPELPIRDLPDGAMPLLPKNQYGNSCGNHHRKELPENSQSERGSRRPDQMVLRRMWGKLLGILRRDSRHLPAGSQSLIQPGYNYLVRQASDLEPVFCCNCKYFGIEIKNGNQC